MPGTWIFDIEADGLYDEVTQVHCGVFKNWHTGEIRKFSPEMEYHLHYMLEFMDTCDCLVGHNILDYDLPVLEKLYGYVYKGNKIDTLVLSRMQDPKRDTPWQCPIKNAPHSVAVWGYRVGRGKPDHDEWDVYSPAMLHRCTEDVEIQTLIYRALLDEQEGYDWQFASWLSNRLFEILSKQARYGWKADVPWMDFCIHMTTKWIDRIDRALERHLPKVLEVQEQKVKGEYKHVKAPFKKDGNYNANMMKWFATTEFDPADKVVGGPFTRVLYRPLDPSSRTEAISYLLDSGWIPKEWNMDKNTGERKSPKFGKDDPFDGVSGKEAELLAKRMQIRHRRSSVEGLKKLVRPDGRIAARVANMAETGRMTHAGIVNIPNADAFFGKWMRKIFICEPDKELVSVDSVSCQDRMLASRVKNDDFTFTLLHGNKADKTTIHYVNQRHLAEAGYDVFYTPCKSLNFAFKFGGSDKKLGQLVHGSEEDGAKVREALLKAAPGLESLLDSLREEWESHAEKRANRWGKVDYHNGWIRGLDGRPVFIDSPHKLLVFMLQSDEAITMSLAYVFLYDWLIQEGYEWGKDWAYVCFYHDEYTIECDPAITDRVKQLGETAIVAAGDYLNLSVPQEGDGAVGRNWYEVH